MRTILVVHDDRVLLELVCSTLERHGYQALTGCDARHGLEAFAEAKDRIELVIAGTVLPGMDTGAMIARMVALNPLLPVLFVAGCLERVEVHTEGLTRFAFLATPFSAGALLDTVQRMLFSTPISERRHLGAAAHEGR